MIIHSRKFKVNKPITIDGEFELTTMTGVSGLIISTGPDTKVTAHPVDEPPADIADLEVPPSTGGD